MLIGLTKMIMLLTLSADKTLPNAMVLVLTTQLRPTFGFVEVRFKTYTYTINRLILFSTILADTIFISKKSR